MAAPAPVELVLYPLVHIITLQIVGVSAFYVYRQKMTAYSYGRGPLIAVHIFFAGLVFFELLRTTLPVSTSFVAIYTVGGTIFVLVDVVLLTLLALTVYLLPKGLGYRGIITEMLSKKTHALLFAAYVAFIVLTAGYLVLAQPFDPNTQAKSVFGLPLPSPQFTPFYLELLLGILLIFLIYPAFLLLLASRKVKDKAVRRVLVILPICWSGIGLDLLAFNGYILSLGIDATPFGYLIASVAFGVTALVFRRASLLTGFFEPVGQLVPATSPFSGRIPTGGVSFDGAESLLEVDPSSNYEEVVRNFAVEQSSHGALVFVFTSRGSPVFNVLSGLEGVRFYLLTSKVSYPKPTERPNEVLAPQNDQAVLLDLLDKTVTSTAGTKASVIFDSISDVILYSGFESCYKFIKQANEILSSPQVSSLFLLTSGAHEERVVNLVRSLYANHVAYDAHGLRLTRGGQAAETQG